MFLAMPTKTEPTTPVPKVNSFRLDQRQRHRPERGEPVVEHAEVEGLAGFLFRTLTQLADLQLADLESREAEVASERRPAGTSRPNAPWS